MSAETKPRKRLEKLVSGVKEKLKGTKRPSRAQVEPAASTPASLVEEKPIEETIRHRAAIAGYVTDSRTKQTIANAVVELAGQNLRAQTHVDGFFYFLNLPAGQHTLKVSAPHLGTRYGSVSVSNVTVQNDAEGRPIFDAKANVELPPTTLVGQVKRSDNDQPIAKAKVQVRGSEAQTLTDKDGNYALSGLQAGMPTVQVSAEGFVTATQKVTLTAGQDTTLNFSLIKS